MNLDAWLRSVLWNSILPGTNSEKILESPNQNFEIHRLKARIPLSNGCVKFVQGVREIFEILDAPQDNVGCNSQLRSWTMSRPQYMNFAESNYQDDSSAESKPPTTGKIVLIGKHIAGLPFDDSYRALVKS